MAFRKAHPALRMTTAQEEEAHITQLSDLEFNVVGSHISAGANGEENEIIAIFNPRENDTEVTLPEGKWTVYIDAENAGTEALATAEGTVTVAAISACVLVKEAASAVPTAPAGVDLLLMAAIAAVIAIAVVAAFVIKKRKK